MKAIVLAAGKGKRLQSEQFQLPKVMRLACEKPLLSYVLSNLSFIKKEDIIIVAGFMREAVTEFAKGYPFAVQEEQLGTGHAVMSASEHFKDYDGDVLVCYGDMPLLKKETYQKLFEIHNKEKNACTLLTGIIDPPPAYGRIVRDNNNLFSGVVEDKDCTPEQKKITELNIGIYVFSSKLLFNCLKELKNNNSQGEYYLTDVPSIMLEKGYKIGTHSTNDQMEMLGVNTVEDLEVVENYINGGQA